MLGRHGGAKCRWTDVGVFYKKDGNDHGERVFKKREEHRMRNKGGGR